MADAEGASNGNGSVRVTNAQIYTELLTQGRKLDRVAGKVEDVLKPGFERQVAQIESLKDNKADKTDLESLSGRLAKVEYRVYAIISGLIASAGIAKGIGLF